jgi:ssDNA thymidine ADP-ribosyltransferase, DarT
MLFTINKGNVPDCPYRQQDIVHFVTTVEAVTSNRLPYVFYDYNATLTIATCYSDVKDLGKIDWDLFHEIPRLDGYCKYWNSDMNRPRYARRRETRQAEFLIHREIPLKLMTVVGAYSEAKAADVRRIFEEAGVRLPVETKPEWYF